MHISSRIAVAAVRERFVALLDGRIRTLHVPGERIISFARRFDCLAVVAPWESGESLICEIG